MKKIDERILYLIEILKANNLYTYNRHFCNSIGMVEQNFTKVRAGTKHFTPEHIYNLIHFYNINANWIFDLSTPDNKVFSIHKQHTNKAKIEQFENR